MQELRVEATAGGGMVTVVVNGAKQLLSLRIDPEVVSKDDVEMLQDLILAAVNDAHRKVDEQLQKTMGGMMRGLKLPGMLSRMSHPEPLARLIEQLQRLPGIGAKSAQRLAYHILGRRGRTRSGCAPRCTTSRSGSPTARSATTSPTSIPCVFCTDDRRERRRHLRRRGAAERRRDREDARVPRHLSRADGRAVAAAGRRARRSEDPAGC